LTKHGVVLQITLEDADFFSALVLHGKDGETIRILHAITIQGRDAIMTIRA
jgi:hypothetical protein